MPYVPNLAATPWFTVGFAVLMVLDVAAWCYALYRLPPSRSNTFLKMLSWCWVALPLAGIFVAGSYVSMVRRAKWHALSLGSATTVVQIKQFVQHPPRWIAPPWVMDASWFYFLLGFYRLAFFSAVRARRQTPRRVGEWIVFVPQVMFLYMLAFVPSGFH